MSIAPLHGRPAPLLFTKNENTQWPRASASDLKSAPLTTRARKLRRRRTLRVVMIGALLIAVATLLAWVMVTLRT